MEFRELLELYKNGKYQEVIDHAESINDFNAVFLLLRSYIALNKFYDALQTYNKYREVLESNNLIESIKVYLFLLVKTEASEAKLEKEVEYFKDKNYINQETEEFLCKLEEYIKQVKNDNKNFEKYSIEEVIEMLKSDDETVVFSALSELINDDKFKSINLLPTIENILKEKCVMNLTYGMLLDFLVSNSYRCNLFFKKDGVYFNIDPSTLTKQNLEQAKLVHQALSHIQSNEKNISIGDFVLKILVKSSYQLAPNYIKNLRELSSFVCAAYYYASEVFKIGLDGDAVYEFYLNVADEEMISNYRDFLKKSF